MEFWDLYTKDRVKTGKTMIRGEKQPEGYYRMVVHVCILNQKGEMLIQQRQPFKKGWSNMWDITVGGSAVSGDTSQSAAEREVLEELGYPLSLENIRPSLTIHFEGGFDDVYIVERELDIESLNLQYEEVQTVKWASMEEILEKIEDGSFIPYHKSFIELLFFMRDHRGMHTRQECNGKPDGEKNRRIDSSI